MKISSVSLGFREYPLQYTINKLQALGFEYFEGTADFPCHLAPYVHGQRPVSELKDILAASTIKLAAIGGDSDFAVNDARWPEQLKMIRSEINLAAELGVKIIRIFASHIPEPYVTEEVWSRMIRNIKIAVPYAEDKGIGLAIENHFGITNSPHDLLRILESVNNPSLGLNLDPANFIPCLEDPAEATKMLCPYAIYSHIKDCIKDEHGSYYGHEFVDIGAGIMDVKEVLKAFKDGGYKGYLTIEYETTKDAERGTVDSLKVLRNVMQEVGISED
jgi:sugar phosphate isomerase/epimerase